MYRFIIMVITAVVLCSSIGSSFAGENPAVGKKIVIKGVCQDHAQNKLADVRIRFVLKNNTHDTNKSLGETKSDHTGYFEFPITENINPDEATIWLGATLDGYSSVVNSFNADRELIYQTLEFTNIPGYLYGKVIDSTGNPIPDVKVNLNHLIFEDIHSATTDQNGNYKIVDKWWDINPGWQSNANSSHFAFQLRHPDYAHTIAYYRKIPEEVNVMLTPPAFIEGTVIDTLTSKPVPHLTVSAQGIAHHHGYSTVTDANGNYQLKVNKDYYHIWAEHETLMPLAVSTLKAFPGDKINGADIKLVHGAYVTGKIYDKNGQQLMPAKNEKIHIGHHGPARPKTGAAVTATTLKEDGTYRIQVAPGKNYIYCMGKQYLHTYVTVRDGQELNLDLRENDREIIYDEDEKRASIIRTELQQAEKQLQQKLNPHRFHKPTSKPPED